jgi:elongation factor Ts
VQEAITEVIGRLGENVVLRRAAIVCSEEAEGVMITGGYAHGVNAEAGRFGSLVVLKAAASPSRDLSTEVLRSMAKLARNLARQVIGYNPLYIHKEDIDNVDQEGVSLKDYAKERVLMSQDYILGGGTVQDVVDAVARDADVHVQVMDFARWECGETANE